MKGINELSDIEKLKCVKSLSVACSSEVEIDDLIRTYLGNMPFEEAKHRLKGLLLEDEFLLLCSVMNACLSVNGLEQGLAINRELKVPDYAVVFNLENCIYDSQKRLKKIACFVEVKTTDGFETNKIGNGFYKKYSAYAGMFGLPLFMASRLKFNEKQQYWIIQNKEQFEERSRKASIENVCDSLNHILLNDVYITSTQDIEVELQFTDKPSESNSYHGGYGFLKQVVVQSEKGSLVLAEEQLSFNLFLDCFAQVEVSSRRTREGWQVTREINFMQSQLLSDMLLRANFCILDNSGAQYTSAGRLLALLESQKSSLIRRDYFEKLLYFFNSKDFLFMVTKIGDDAGNEKLIDGLLNG